MMAVPESPSPDLSEAAIKAQIITYLKYNKVFCWVQSNAAIWDVTKHTFRRHNSNMKRGVADILGIYNGRMLAIEVKSKTGRLSQHQVEFLEDVNRHGGIAFVARSIDDVIRYLNR